MILDILLTPHIIPFSIALYFLIPFLTRNTELNDVPGPFAAKFSRLWLLLQARQGKRYQSVHDAHAEYGKMVRIQPDHVSIADESAINIIYGHGNGFLKSWVLLSSEPAGRANSQQ